jgi:hypothetical protein
MQEEQKK